MLGGRHCLPLPLQTEEESLVSEGTPGKLMPNEDPEY